MNIYTADPLLERIPVVDVHRLAQRAPATAGDRVRCPECHRIADVVDRFDLESTDGPVEHIRMRCAEGRHHFTMPVASLTSG